MTADQPDETATNAEPTVQIVDNAPARCYEIHVDGTRIGLASYFRDGDVVIMPHTETDPAFQRRGFAARLVRFALDDIAAQGLRVQPACPYVRRFVQRNPEYQPLVAD